MAGSFIPDSTRAGEPPRGDCIRVLVVDNDVDTVVSTAKLFELNGHTAQTAVNGQEALEHVVPFRPDLILLDVAMPGMNGIEVAQTVRRMRLTKPPVLAAVSGHTLPYYKRHCAESGFDHYLVKPVNLVEYAELVKFVTNTSHPREASIGAQSSHKADVYAFNWSQLEFCSLILDFVPNIRTRPARGVRLEKVERTLTLVEAWIEKDLDTKEEQKYRIQLQVAELKSRLKVQGQNILSMD